MNLRHFVSASAVVLVGWLAVTFVYHMPSQRYPKQGRQAAPTAAKDGLPPESRPTAEPFPASASR